MNQQAAKDRAERQQVAQQILPIILNTRIASSIAITEPPEDVPGITARRIADNVQTWVLTGDWPDRPLTDQDVEARVARLREVHRPVDSADGRVCADCKHAWLCPTTATLNAYGYANAAPGGGVR